MGYDIKRQISSSQIVVQCPSCHTTFALDRSLIADIDEPKFHCSRCDNVFLYEIPNISTLNARADLNKTEENIPSGNQTSQPSFVRRSGVISSSKLRPSITASNTSPTISEDSSTIPEYQPSSTFQTSISSQALAAQAQPSIKPQKIDQNNPINQYTNPTPIPDNKNLLPLSKISRSFLRSPVSSNGLLVICGPIFLIIACLVGLTYYIHINPKTAKTISAFIPNNTAMIPPDGIYISDSKLDSVMLENGDTLLLISGVARNDTGMNFSETKIEGSISDGSGQVIKASIAHLDSALVDTRISTLSLQTIERLQQGPRSKHFLLAPGQERPFAVAIPAPRSPVAKYYSARVFSVRE